MDIKNIYGDVIFTSEALSLRDTVLDAVKKKTNLSYSDLRGSNLSYSDLSCSDLRDSDLRDSNLSYSDLRGSDLSYSNLSYSDLRGSDLSYSNLRGSNLSYSNLSCSNLRGSNLSCSNLSCSNLSDAKKVGTALSQIQFLPEEGSFIGWKKCFGGVIVKLQITENAKRSHGTERKARCSEALVLEIFGSDVAKSGGGYEIITYREGEIVQPDGWDENRWNVCSQGIHFFLTRAEAEAYNL